VLGVAGTWVAAGTTRHHRADEVLVKIGEVAAAANVNVQTLRYYERRKLLSPPRRTRSGYRDYDEEAVSLVSFIKRAQELGFTLNEVEELLKLRDGAGTCAEAREAGLVKMADIDEKVRQLKAMRKALERLVDSCEVEGDERDCPILEALEGTRRRGVR